MLRQRAISAIGIVLVAAVPAFIGGPLFAVVVAILGVLGSYELLRAETNNGARPLRFPAYLATLALIAAVAFDGSPTLLAGIVTAAVFVPLAIAIFRPTPIPGHADWALTVAGTLYVAIPLAHFVALRALPGPATRAWVDSLADTLGSGGSALGLAWFGLALAVTWLTDTAAYLVGRQFGSTKLIPSISPGKTRVGAIAGVVAGALTGVGAAALFGVPIAWYLALGVGCLLAVVGQLGDLAESLLKRSLGTKDMGTLIPGHGGILDRIDALLFTIPTAYYLARLLELL